MMTNHRDAKRAKEGKPSEAIALVADYLCSSGGKRLSIGWQGDRQMTPLGRKVIVPFLLVAYLITSVASASPSLSDPWGEDEWMQDSDLPFWDPEFWTVAHWKQVAVNEVENDLNTWMNLVNAFDENPIVGGAAWVTLGTIALFYRPSAKKTLLTLKATEKLLSENATRSEMVKKLTDWIYYANMKRPLFRPLRYNNLQRLFASFSDKELEYMVKQLDAGKLSQTQVIRFLQSTPDQIAKIMGVK